MKHKSSKLTERWPSGRGPGLLPLFIPPSPFWNLCTIRVRPLAFFFVEVNTWIVYFGHWALTTAKIVTRARKYLEIMTAGIECDRPVALEDESCWESEDESSSACLYTVLGQKFNQTHGSSIRPPPPSLNLNFPFMGTESFNFFVWPRFFWEMRQW